MNHAHRIEATSTDPQRPTAGSHDMSSSRRSRRAVALARIVAGGLLMLLSTAVRAGLVAFALGVLLEVIALALDHLDR
jgi:hypothetical protein